MAMTRCDECDELIDSDDDPECFTGIEHNYKERILCGNCREELLDEQ